MKSFFKLFGIIAMAAVIGFSIVGCDVPPDPDENENENENENGGNNNGPASGGNPSGTVTTDTTSEGTVLSGSANLAAKLAWLDRNAESHNTYIIEVNANNNIEPYTFNYSGAINITVILRGVGANRTIRLTKNGTLFTVNSNVTFVLDNNITLQGHSQNTGPMVNVNGGIFIMNTGSNITGNSQRGVNSENGNFEMNGGTISGNAGGVSLKYGSFTMNDGTISGNTASSGGGVLYLQYASGSFTMNGGTISDNTATSYGGGVCLSGSFDRINFTMNEGTISGNTASYGGGVHLSGYNSFIMKGGTIIGNTAKEYGGGVYGSIYYVVGTINKTGGTITGYSSDPSNGNVVRDNSGVIARRGHAVYAECKSSTGADVTYRKETTAGPSDNLSSSSSAGWDE